ncbi:MAG: ABC transporter permease [Deltaproteobacteria bacterium]|nr:ABC transporter permease [Deltaproteobacteria bacterium]
MTLAKIAFRNVLKNRRRSLITILAIGFGFMAVAMFKGYTHNSYQKITLGAVFREAPGHLVVFKKGFLEEGKIDPAKYLFSGEQVEALRRLLRAEPAVVWTAPKLALSGLITNGDTSTIFIADAMDPVEERAIWAFFPGPSASRREALPASTPFASLLGPQLARLLRLRVGDGAVLMATTRAGQMNAVDVQVAGFCPTISDAIDDKYLKIPLSLARNLYDFDGADRICVLLRDERLTGPVKASLSRTLGAQTGLQLDIRTWADLSLYYQKVKSFLDVVFLFIFSIVMVIAVMGTFNTMSMAVYERTREIGTLRALGLKPRSVVRLFATEGALLGLLGSLLGSALTGVGYLLLRAAHLTYKPPGVAENVPVEIDLVPRVLAVSFLFFVALSIFSAAVPARRAARQSIVDALAHV